MDDEGILSLYDWAPNICFRHPARGTVDTTLVKTIQPRIDGEKEIRACRDCVLAMEAIRQDTARRSGGEYEPGHAGEMLA